MRVLFTCVPGYGHLLPLTPLMAAALDDGHEVALALSADMAAVVAQELPPGITHLPAGLAFAELPREAARHTGANIFSPTAQVAGEMFGGVLIDTAGDTARAAAREWGAEVVVCDVYDSVGALVAADLGIAWHCVGLLTGIPTEVATETRRAAAPRYARRGLTPLVATSHLRLCPPSLAHPGSEPKDVPVYPLRPRAHRRPPSTAPSFQPVPTDPARATAVVTLGTVFSDPATLATTLKAVSAAGVHVLGTVGDTAQRAPTSPGNHAATSQPRVHTVPFVPLDDLLHGADLVVSTGGSGTVLAALARGIPLVLWPQGADQPRNAECVTAAGAAVTVSSASELTSAVTTVLSDRSYAHHAHRIAAEIAAMPDEHNVLRNAIIGTPFTHISC